MNKLVSMLKETKQALNQKTEEVKSLQLEIQTLKEQNKILEESKNTETPNTTEELVQSNDSQILSEEITESTISGTPIVISEMESTENLESVEGILESKVETTTDDQMSTETAARIRPFDFQITKRKDTNQSQGKKLQPVKLKRSAIQLSEEQTLKKSRTEDPESQIEGTGD